MRPCMIHLSIPISPYLFNIYLYLSISIYVPINLSVYLSISIGVYMCALFKYLILLQFSCASNHQTFPWFLISPKNISPKWIHTHTVPIYFKYNHGTLSALFILTLLWCQHLKTDSDFWFDKFRSLMWFIIQNFFIKPSLQIHVLSLQ